MTDTTDDKIEELETLLAQRARARSEAVTKKVVAKAVADQAIAHADSVTTALLFGQFMDLVKAYIQPLPGPVEAQLVIGRAWCQYLKDHGNG